MVLTWIIAQLFATQVQAMELKLKERVLPPRHNECHLCHISQRSSFISTKVKTKLEHNQVHAIHGKKQLSCNHCHDKGNHNYLKKPATFKDSSPVCQQCHMETYREFVNGAHGKITGGWRPEKKQYYHCIDCHNPHDVKYKEMQARPAPVISR